MKELQTDKGVTVKVDDDVALFLASKRARLFLGANGSVRIYYREAQNTVQGTLSAHILGIVGSRRKVGYKDGNLLNCTRDNLLLDKGAVCKSKDNKYYGVLTQPQGYYNVVIRNSEQAIKEGSKVRIVVGSYSDQVVAAIAYNKAMDMVYGKDMYVKNVLNISQALYDRIYKEVTVDIRTRHTKQGTNQKRNACDSIYTGVHKSKSAGVWYGKWRAGITYKQEMFYLGSYATEVEAAQAYNQAAVYFYGKEARLNDVPKPMHSILNIELLKKKVAEKLAAKV